MGEVRRRAAEVLMRTLNDIKGHVLFASVVGSHLYGTHTENSDVSIAVVFAPPFNDVLRGNCVYHFAKKYPDLNAEICCYSIQRVISLLQEGDSKTVELLFAWRVPNCVLHAAQDWLIFFQRVIPALPFPNKLLEFVTSVHADCKQKGSQSRLYNPETLSHAIRCAEELHEFLLYSDITFPRPNAELLKSIKLGSYPLEHALRSLEDALLECRKLVNTYKANADFNEATTQWLRSYYLREGTRW